MIDISQATSAQTTAIQKLLKKVWKDTYGDHLSQITLDEVYKNFQNIEFLKSQIQNVRDMYFPVVIQQKK